MRRRDAGGRMRHRSLANPLSMLSRRTSAAGEREQVALEDLDRLRHRADLVAAIGAGDRRAESRRERRYIVSIGARNGRSERFDQTTARSGRHGVNALMSLRLNNRVRMPLNIRSVEVNQLAETLAARKRISKTDAVKQALEIELRRLDQALSRRERLRPLQDRVMARPPTGLEADKTFYDDLSKQH